MEKKEIITTNFDPAFWHKRFRQQTKWTKNLRDFFFNQVDLISNELILEVGSGTGAVIEDINKDIAIPIFGIDISFQSLSFSHEKKYSNLNICADALRLPFAQDTFYISYCHYLLMWVNNATNALTEMKRVTKSSGYVVAFAEPDYGGRIDYPQTLEKLGLLQNRALQMMKAQINMGRQLLDIFRELGLLDIEFGSLQHHLKNSGNNEDLLEEQVLSYDLQMLESKPEISEKEIEELLKLDKKAWRSGKRLLYVPTFYCWGKVP